MFNLTTIKSSFTTTNVINTLKAIDNKIDAADAAYMNGCDKAQDKIVETTVSTSKRVASKSVELKDKVANSKTVVSVKTQVSNTHEKVMSNNVVRTVNDTAHVVLDALNVTSQVTSWVAKNVHKVTDKVSVKTTDMLSDTDTDTDVNEDVQVLSNTFPK